MIISMLNIKASSSVLIRNIGPSFKYSCKVAVILISKMRRLCITHVLSSLPNMLSSFKIRHIGLFDKYQSASQEAEAKKTL